jgi:putative ABC transport system permease protein
MLRNYLKIAFKVLLRRKFFTAISLFCIVFTLVVLMVVTAFLDHMLMPMAPEVNLDRSLRCTYMEMRGDESRRSGDPGYMFLDRYVRPLPGAEAVTVFSEADPAVTYRDDQKFVSQLRHADGTYWHVLRFKFLEGGPFTDADDRDGKAVAVINAATRQRMFGANSTALGRDIELDGRMFRVVGVVANVPLYRQTAYADVWVPIGSNVSDHYREELMGGFEAIVLAPTRGDLPRLKAEFTAMLPGVVMTRPETFKEMRGILRTYGEVQAMSMLPGYKPDAGRWREFLLMIVGVALLFMSLPAMNLVNINLSRILERSSEIGVRKAFGASSAALVWQFVLENVVLCLVGGTLALAMTWIVLQVVQHSGVFPYAVFSLNWRLFGWAVALATFFGVLSGVYPAWRMSRLHPVLALRGGSQ